MTDTLQKKLSDSITEDEVKMKFKHTIHLLIDNFKTTYKLLVFRIIITVLTMLAYYGFITLLFKNINNFASYTALKDTITNTINAFLEGNITGVGENIPRIVDLVSEFMQDLANSTSLFVGFVIEILAVSLVSRFLQGLGNYTASELINDKMAMQSNSPFVITLIKNLGKACAYSGIYAPLSLIYDGLSVVVIYLVLIVAIPKLPILALIFLVTLCMILLIALKLTFTTDWLPAMVCGKKNVGKAMGYSFVRKSKGTASAYIFFASSCVLIMGVNVAAAIFTLGVGTIITIPLSYTYLLCYEFANYYDNNEIKFFVDKRTIVRPEHEKEISREDFLRGE